MRLQGKVAVITGAARGIGAAMAERFAAEGAKVVVADTDPMAGDETVGRIKTAGGEARFVACDVTDRSQVTALMDRALESYGSLDIVAANAGIIHNTPFLELDDATFDRVIAVNLKGVFLTGQEAARRMVERGIPGVIVNTASVNAVIVPYGLAAYNASKGGVGQLTKTMAIELAPHGIRVNAIGPGSVATDMFRSAILTDPGAMDRVKARTPLGRPAEPAEIAACALFLASDDASYMTGQTIYPDGGRLALSQVVPKTGG
ncbi:MAG: SDR family oxidoreductase [Alphaproteobacteria bacterium]|nr:SDR family oxidoreductase [Alphaproteobacteria bacterium]